MRFEKWHGAGNAYLVIEEAELRHELRPAQVTRICHPDLGAGSDGILVIAATAPQRVRILNPDGSEAEFSGNGTRIAVGYLARRDRLKELTIDTLKGPVSGTIDGNMVTVDAGSAALDGADHVPSDGPAPAPGYRFVNLGNPHCVIRDPAVDGLDLAAVGPPIERHPWFPNRTNVEFYRPLGERSIRMRVWERGAGETMSSGSGSIAAAVAAVVAGDVRSPVTVHTDGGRLTVEIGADLAVRLTGPVEPVVGGRFEDSFMATLEAL